MNVRGRGRLITALGDGATCHGLYRTHRGISLPPSSHGGFGWVNAPKHSSLFPLWSCDFSALATSASLSFRDPDHRPLENATASSVAGATTSHGASVPIDGNTIQDIPGPEELPYIGNFFEVFPDHPRNHQRLFKKYRPIIKTSNIGSTIYCKNNPAIVSIVSKRTSF